MAETDGSSEGPTFLTEDELGASGPVEPSAPSWPFTCGVCGSRDVYPAPLAELVCLDCNPAVKAVVIVTVVVAAGGEDGGRG